MIIEIKIRELNVLFKSSILGYHDSKKNEMNIKKIIDKIPTTIFVIPIFLLMKYLNLGVSCMMTPNTGMSIEIEIIKS